MNIFTKRGLRFLGIIFAFGYGIGAALYIFALATLTNTSLYEACLMVGRALLSFIGGAWILSKIWRIARRYLFVGRL